MDILVNLQNNPQSNCYFLLETLVESVIFACRKSFCIMRQLISLAYVLSAFIVLSSCSNGAQKRIVSNTPIKTEVMGLRLCDASSEKVIENAISKEVGKNVIGESYKNGVGTVVRVFPVSLDINYGGLSWHYVDVSLNEDKKIVQITLVGSFESIERAKEQFETAKQVFTQKYGNGNNNEAYQLMFWTDDTNSVGLSYEESSSINGSDRSFCSLYYVNIELAEALEKANTPDV